MGLGYLSYVTYISKRYKNYMQLRVKIAYNMLKKADHIIIFAYKIFKSCM